MNSKTGFLTFILISLGGALLLANVDNQQASKAEEPDQELPTQTEDIAKRMRAGVQSVTPTEIFQRSVEEVSYSTCLPCHGAQASGTKAIYAPPLAGQTRWYLERQIEHFRLSIRGGHPNDVHGAVMHPIARALVISDDVKDVLDKIDAFPAHDPVPTIEGGEIEAGQLIYHQLCQQCHGENGQGNEDEGGPRLNILPDWYILRQLRNFQAGFRGEHASDVYGHEMRPMALAVMEQQEMKNVIAYIQSLGVEDMEPSEGSGERFDRTEAGSRSRL